MNDYDIRSVVIDYLEHTFQQDDVGIAFLYFNSNDEANQTDGNCISSLVQQLVRRLAYIPDQVKALYSEYISQTTRPSLVEYSQLLEVVCRLFSKVYIVVDGLDECHKESLIPKGLLIEIQELSPSIRLLFTSRIYPYLKEKFPKITCLEIQSKPTDHDVINIAAELQARDEFKYSSDNFVESNILRIFDQSTEKVELAKKVVTWILCASRPLKLQEFRHAYRVHRDSTDIDEATLSNVKKLEQEILCACGGLVIIDPESSVMHFAHLGICAAFERRRHYMFPDAHNEIAMVCLVYLSFDPLERYCTSDVQLEVRHKRYPLLRYAAQNWAHHVRHGSEITNLDKIMELLSHDSKVSSITQAAELNPSVHQNFSPEPNPGVFMAASCGLHDTVKRFLENGVNPSSTNSIDETALQLAAFGGHQMVVQLLLDWDYPKMELKGRHGRATLASAADSGQEAVVKLLLERDDLDVNATVDDLKRTALHLAARNGYAAVVKLLLARGDVDVNSKDHRGNTPLALAVNNGHVKVVKLLLERNDVEANTKDYYDETLLANAAKNGQEEVVKLLLERDDLDVNATIDDDQRTALQLAAMYGHEAVVKRR